MMLKLQKVLKDLNSDQINLVVNSELVAGAAASRASSGSKGSRGSRG